MTVEVVPPPPGQPQQPVAFHRLFRLSPNYAAWKPLVAIVLLAVFVIVGSIVVVVAGFGMAVAAGEIRFDTAANLTHDLLQLAVIDAANPISLFIALGSVAIWLPAVPLALLCAGIRPVSVVSSVALRVRWRWLASCLVPAVAVMAVNLALTLGIGVAAGQPLAAPSTPPAVFALCAVLIVLLTPIQSAAEEYVFRGLLFQAIGSWVRWVPLAMLLTTVLFALGHLQYDAWGMVDVGVFGLFAAIIAWRTGGLEAGIVMHAVNNVTLFLLLSSGVLGASVVSSEGSGPLPLAITLVTQGGYLFWVDRLAARRGLVRRRAVEPVEPAAL